MEYEKIIQKWREFETPFVKDRGINIELSHDLITAISGPRRSGKTFLCFQKINNLLKEGATKDNIFYINFEDDKLANAHAEDLEKLFEFFLEKAKDSKIKYLFLDEIQVVDKWDSWVRKTYDQQKNLKIILTGSSSKMLSKEISTNLRGRVYNIEILPLSFKEYLNWKEEKLNFESILNNGKDSLKAKKYFREFISKGGYPSVFNNPKISDEILQSYYDSMIFKDVVERHKIADVKKLQILAKLLFESCTKEISYNNLSNKLKSLGFAIGKSTVINYISYFEDAYLFFQVLKYEYSIQKQLGSIKKIYCIDNGLLSSVSFSFSENKGKLLENQVFLELRRHNKEIYYNRDKFECDFVVKEKNKIIETVQVCYALNEDNQKREIDGLVESMKKFKLEKGTIVTFDQEKELKIEKFKINVLPFWKWALKNGE